MALKSKEGAGQGDSLGPLFYCAGHGRVIRLTKKQLADEHIQANLISYIDNVVIAPSLLPRARAGVFRMLVDNMEKMAGIRTNLDSSSVFGPDPGALSQCKPLFPNGVMISTDTKLLGVPIGSTGFIQEYVATKLSKKDRRQADLNPFDAGHPGRADYATLRQ